MPHRPGQQAAQENNSRAQEHRPAGSWAAVVDEQLAAIYAQIPPVACRGLCGPVDCHETIDMGARERQRLRAAGVRLPDRQEAKRRAALGALASCPALSDDGRCSVYTLRPALCRIYSATEGLACPYGCIVLDGFTPLTLVEAYALVEAARVAGTTEWPTTARQFEEQMNTPLGERVLRQLADDQQHRRAQARSAPQGSRKQHLPQRER